MLKATINLDFTNFQRIVNQLPSKEKFILVRMLEKDTISDRIQALLKKIDKKRKNHPIKTAEIKNEIAKARKTIYG